MSLGNVLFIFIICLFCDINNFVYIFSRYVIF